MYDLTNQYDIFCMEVFIRKIVDYEIVSTALIVLLLLDSGVKTLMYCA